MTKKTKWQNENMCCLKFILTKFRWTHAFMLVHVHNTNAYTMFARTAEDKTKWIEAFKEALDNVLPRQRINSPHEVSDF